MSEGSSEAGSIASYSAHSTKIDDIAAYVAKLLNTERSLTTQRHINAAEALHGLQTALSTQSITQKSQLGLVFSCTSLMRRRVRLEEEVAEALAVPEEEQGSASPVEALRDDVEDVTSTLTLCFLTICIADVSARGGVAADVDEASEQLAAVLDRSVWQVVSTYNKKRPREPDASIEENERNRLIAEALGDLPFAQHDSRSWMAATTQPGVLASACVRVAGGMLFECNRGAFSRFTELAELFASSTSQQLAIQLLKADRAFCSLAMQRIAAAPIDERESSLRAIARGGESESGQTVLRDLLLSFLAPRSVVGVRRTLLLPREIADNITKQTPWFASIAHQAAMQGCEHLYDTATADLRRTCALLSGVALLTTSGTDDPIRKARAFGGRVQLPFLETTPPDKHTKRIALVPTTCSWTVYSLSENGAPAVECTHAGLNGLMMCVLAVRDSL